MEKKKVKYQITRKEYELVEVETEEQEGLIKELNRNFEREDKRDKAYKARYLSLDSLCENSGIEAAEDSLNAEELCLISEQKELIKKSIHKALAQLSSRQREIIVMAFFEEKPQTIIARELGVTEGTVSVTLERAKANLKKILKNDKEIF